jgi:hypothetical protein
MLITWQWRDVAPARSGGRPLPNAVRFFFVTVAFGGGVLFGDVLRLLGV